MAQLGFHPIANVFPLIAGQEFDDLVADIVAHGVREPAVLYEGAILDGRNRWRASVEARVECPTVEYEGDDPVAFVVSLNLRRRHMSESQRAMVAANIATLPRGGDRSKPPIDGLTTAGAASLLNVSEKSVERARVVRDHAIPEIAEKVSAGTLAVSTAAEAARLPQEEQRRMAQLNGRGLVETIKAAVKYAVEKENAARTDTLKVDDHPKSTQRTIIDLKGRDPAEFNLAMHYVGGWEYAARDLTALKHAAALPILTSPERERLHKAIMAINAITGRTIGRL